MVKEIHEIFKIWFEMIKVFKAQTLITGSLAWSCLKFKNEFLAFSLKVVLLRLKSEKSNWFEVFSNRLINY